MKNILYLVLLLPIMIGSIQCNSKHPSQNSNIQNHFLTSTTNTISPENKKSAQSAEKLENTLSKIANTVEPAVVNIRAEKKVNTNNLSVQSPFNFFNNPFPPHNEKPKAKKTQAIGSGFIFNKEGYIITNNHVIEGAEDITVILQNEKEFQAEVVGQDKISDIAVLKIKGRGNLYAVPLGDSDRIQSGNLVIAIGNPFGLTGTFTFGVISAMGRTNGNIDKYAAFKNYIQTDTAINQGNSGGPLLDIYGKVIGVNSAILSSGGSGSIGIGFAIPINIAKNVAEQLISKGKVERGYIGVMIRDLNSSLAKHLKLQNREGTLVNSVEPGGPAAKSGIKPGDIILMVNNKNIKNSASLINIVSAYQPNENITLIILRKGKKIKLDIVVDKRPEKVSWASQSKSIHANVNHKVWLGLTIGSIKKYRQIFRLKSSSGVVIVNIEPDSAGARGELQRGDILESINQIEVKDLKTFSRVMELEKRKKSFLLAIIRNGQRKFVVITSK